MADPGADPIEALRQIEGVAERLERPQDIGRQAARRLAGSLRAALAALPAPVPEGVPEDHRVCSHGIYHHGCPSCDRQDPEERL